MARTSHTTTRRGMKANHKELLEKWKSESPEKRRKGFANLARAMNFPDLVPIEEMTKEEVEASLRRQGFTDDDFKRMNEKIEAVLDKYLPDRKGDLHETS
jgi:hypothetical protein